MAQSAPKANGGRMSPLTQKLARLGSSGKHPGNIERDLHHALQLPIPFFWVDIPVRSDLDRNTVELASLPILLPHQVYHYLFEAGLCKREHFNDYYFGKNIWNVVLIILQKMGHRETNHIPFHPFVSKDSGKLVRDEEVINRFWDHCCATGFLQADHPGKGQNPMGFYGDDCRYSKSGDKLVVLACNCLLQETRRIPPLQQYSFAGSPQIALNSFCFGVISYSYIASMSKSFGLQHQAWTFADSLCLYFELAG